MRNTPGGRERQTRQQDTYEAQEGRCSHHTGGEKGKRTKTGSRQEVNMNKQNTRGQLLQNKTFFSIALAKRGRGRPK